MKLSIWSHYLYGLSTEESIKKFAEYGIKFMELSDYHGLELIARGGDPSELGRKVGEYARECGVEILQGHLWLCMDLCRTENVVDILKKWIDLFCGIGIKSAVLHCDSFKEEDITETERSKRNAEVLKELVDYIGDRDLTICLENLIYTFKSIEHLLETIEFAGGSDKLGVCLDTGHLNVTKASSQKEFIEKCGKRLRAIHITNNDGTADQHTAPFGRGDVDFIEVFRALKENGFDMPINYEIPGESGYCPLELRYEKFDFIKKGFDYLVKNS